MSAQTRSAVEEAIAAHISDENGGALLTGFILVATGVSPEDQTGTRYSTLEPDTQPVHVSLGLVEYLRLQQHGDLNPTDVDD
jgi:hypothetical protein